MESSLLLCLQKPQGPSRAVEVMSAKSSLGHSEAGAGALGVMRMAAKLEAFNIAPLAHLRTLNPHVLGILQSSQGNCQAFVPRQLSPGNTSSICSGISSFAFQVWPVMRLLHFLHDLFLCMPAWLLWPRTTVEGGKSVQGTNAHLLSSADMHTGQSGDAPAQQHIPWWRRQRYWHMAESHPLLHKAQAISPGQSMRAISNLQYAGLAILRQNQVSSSAVETHIQGHGGRLVTDALGDLLMFLTLLSMSIVQMICISALKAKKL